MRHLMGEDGEGAQKGRGGVQKILYAAANDGRAAACLGGQSVVSLSLFRYDCDHRQAA